MFCDAPNHLCFRDRHVGREVPDSEQERFGLDESLGLFSTNRIVKKGLDGDQM